MNTPQDKVLPAASDGSHCVSRQQLERVRSAVESPAC